MTGRRVWLPYLSSVQLVTTYKCQVACPHCILEAGPHRKEELALSDAYDWIRQIADYRHGHIKMLSLTGGEPFYDVRRLQAMAAFADSRGLLVGAITNAFWASSPERAIQTLRGIPELRVLAISADSYHQEQISFDRVRNAIIAAKENGTLCFVHMCTEDVEDEAYKRIMAELLELTDADSITTVTTFPLGRALERLGTNRYRMIDKPPISGCLSCNDVTLLPDGRVLACVGPLITLKDWHPLVLGSLRESSLASILEAAEHNPVLHAIRIWGPSILVTLVEGAGLGEHLPPKYIMGSICHPCYSLMSSPAIVRYLDGLTRDQDFAGLVAYARARYLGEYQMVRSHPRRRRSKPRPQLR